MKGRAVVRVLVMTLVLLVVIGAVGFIWFGKRADTYREKFSEVHPGMTKTEVVAVVGRPPLVDTSEGIYERWIFDVPSAFAERPQCFFKLGDSVLVRFTWEPVDTSLVDDGGSMR